MYDVACVRRWFRAVLLLVVCVDGVMWRRCWLLLLVVFVVVVVVVVVCSL